MRIFLALLLAGLTGFAASPPPMRYNQFTTNVPGVPVTGNVVIAGTNTAAYYLGNGSLLTGLLGGGDVTTSQLNTSSNELHNLILSSSNSVRLVSGAASTNAINTSSNALNSFIGSSSNAAVLTAGVNSTNAINTSSNALHSTLLSASNSVRLVVGVDTTNAINFSSNAVRLVAGLASTNAIDYTSNILSGLIGGGAGTNHLVQATNLVGAITHVTSPAWTNGTSLITLGNTNVTVAGGILTYANNSAGFGLANRRDFSTWFGNGAGSGQTGSGYTSVGYNAGLNSTGGGVTSVGEQAGANSSSFGFTSIGSSSGAALGAYSVAVGYSSGGSASGIWNTACGSYTLYSSSATNNSMFGQNAMYSPHIRGSDSAGIGSQVLYGNSGWGSVGAGVFSLYANAGSNSVAVGRNSAINNAAPGVTAIGTDTLMYNSRGTNNTALGYRAGYTNRSEFMFPFTSALEATNTSGGSNWTALAVATGIAGGIPTNTVINLAGLTVATNNTTWTVLATNSTNIIIDRKWATGALVGSGTLSYGGMNINNTFLGAWTASNVWHSAGGVYVGFSAGPSVATAESNKLYIANSTGVPLIGGDFSTRSVTVDATFTALRAGRGLLVVSNSTVCTMASDATPNTVTNWTLASHGNYVGLSATNGTMTLTNAGTYSLMISGDIDATGAASILAEVYLDTQATGLRRHLDIAATSLHQGFTIIGYVTATAGQVLTLKLSSAASETLTIENAQMSVKQD